ncbi:MAG: CHASE2 domain-containing protein [Bacteroidaceae bacterium]|nr:CHASE2 domain-containing protein [Bacteroidaceae bacterium]
MKKLFWLKDHIAVSLLALCILWICSTVAMNLSFFNPVQRAIKNFSLSDVYYQMMQQSGKSQISSLITIIDATSYYDRSKIGQMMREVSQCQPAVVGVDCIYEGFRGDTIGSDNLAEGIFSLPNPIFAFKLNNFDEKKGEFTATRHSFFTFVEDLTEGYSNISYDSNGITVRNLVTQKIVNGDTLYSLPYQMARAFTPDVEEFASTEERIIDYTPTVFPVVPCDSILQNAELLKDRIVFIGATHDDADMHFSPYGRIPGTIIQAYILQTLLEHHRTREVNFWVVLLVSFLVIVLTDIVQTRILRWGKKQENPWLRLIFSSALTRNLINFVWIGFLLYLNFLLFSLHDLYFNPTIMLVSIAFLVEARLFYEAGKEALKISLKS